MSERYTEEQVIEAISRLNRARLQSFIETGTVRPVRSSEGHYFRRVDVARLELMCELSEIFEIEGDALDVVMSLIDQLHRARRELRVVLEAVSQEPSDDIRRRVGEALRREIGS